MRLSRSVPLLVVCALGLCSAPARAAEGLQGGTARAPGWRVNSEAYPTNLPPGGEGFIEVDVYDIGAAPSSGPVTVTDTLPAGVKYGGKPPQYAESSTLEPWSCTGVTTVTCTSTEPVSGTNEHRIDLLVEVEPGPNRTGQNVVSATGGGALGSARTSNEIVLSSTPAGFGFANFEAWASNPNGTIDTQAGSHPYEVVVSFALNTIQQPGVPSSELSVKPAVSEAEGVTVNLPPGIVGDPLATPRCPAAVFSKEACPAATQIGVDVPYLGDTFHLTTPIFNVVPPPGVPAQFAFDILGIKTFLNASVRSNGDYGITENVQHLAQKDIVSNQAVIWGVPADPSHTPERCGAVEGSGLCGQPAAGSGEVPFLTLPTSCGPAPEFTIEEDAWLDPGLTAGSSFTYADAYSRPAGVTGCSHLSVAPAAHIAPDTSYADTPTGLSVEIKVPQEGLLQDNQAAPSDLKNTTVTLPEGVAINPGQAAGLQACQSSQNGVGAEGPAHCPPASKVGTVAIASPLLTDKLEGDVYVLQSNPPALKLLLAASGDGVDLKLVGEVRLDETTGRLTTTFAETPELPFTDFKLSFSGGAQAALTTPTGCGTYTSAADFTPWSTPLSPDVFSESSFAIGAGTAGAPCPSLPLPFSPSLSAGATTDQAGGFTDFSLLLQRPDDQQRVSTLSFKTPEGLLGMLSKVPLCPEPQAAQGTCTAASQIGHTVVAAGPGPYPLVVPQPGQPPAPIYLTGGYRGAPFGLSIVVPLVVGPFTLQTQVVRASISVDPHTAQLTITTDPLPAIVDGIPTDLRSIDAVVDREGFMFNPTDCSPQSFSGTATSATGTQAPLSSHFQMGSCQSLKFAPDFKVATSGRSSRQAGASLTAKILYPTGPLGDNQASSQSNIASVKVDLPKQLPSRLTTLQKACPAQVFDTDPANCPNASVVGHATAITPVLPVALNGPAYFVSHGGEAFPSLIVVLQGYGVTVDLVGSTFISKAGITSSTFKQVPDVPISAFELVLPEGRFSALAANLPAAAKGSFCGQRLAMPTAFVGQNGAEIHQSTPIAVEGCSNALSIASHSIKGRNVTLAVGVPAAGRLKASGRGLSSWAKTSKGRETVTVTLHATKRGKLFTSVKLTFTPAKGKKLAKSLTVRFKK